MGGELEVAGGLMQQPCKYQRQTVDLDVPARAEIIIEGVLDPSPACARGGALRRGIRATTHGVGPYPVISVTAITMAPRADLRRRFQCQQRALGDRRPGAHGLLAQRARDVCPQC